MESLALAFYLRDDARSGGRQYSHDSSINPCDHPHSRRVTRQGKWANWSREWARVFGSFSLFRTGHRTTRDGLGNRHQYDSDTPRDTSSPLTLISS